MPDLPKVDHPEWTATHPPVRRSPAPLRHGKERKKVTPDQGLMAWAWPSSAMWPSSASAAVPEQKATEGWRHQGLDGTLLRTA